MYINFYPKIEIIPGNHQHPVFGALERREDQRLYNLHPFNGFLQTWAKNVSIWREIG